MNREEILKNTQVVFQDVFMDNSLLIHPETVAGDIEMWDSLTHIELISAIELKFNIHFTFREIMNFKTVSDMLSCIEQHIQKKHG